MLDGQNITSLHTGNLIYTNNCIEVYDDAGRYYKMPVSTIIQMVNEFNFTVEKKRKYNWLTEASRKEEFVECYRLR